MILPLENLAFYGSGLLHSIKDQMPGAQNQRKHGVTSVMYVLVVLGANVIYTKEYLQLLLFIKLEFDILK